MRRPRLLNENEVRAVEDLRKGGQQQKVIDGEIHTLAVLPLSFWIPGDLNKGTAEARAGVYVEDRLEVMEWANPEFAQAIQAEREIIFPRKEGQ